MGGDRNEAAYTDGEVRAAKQKSSEFRAEGGAGATARRADSRRGAGPW